MIDAELSKIADLMKRHPNKDVLKAIRLAMANYAMAAVMDSQVREEAEAICNETEY